MIKNNLGRLLEICRRRGTMEYQNIQRMKRDRDIRSEVSRGVISQDERVIRMSDSLLRMYSPNEIKNMDDSQIKALYRLHSAERKGR